MASAVGGGEGKGRAGREKERGFGWLGFGVRKRGIRNCTIASRREKERDERGREGEREREGERGREKGGERREN